MAAVGVTDIHGMADMGMPDMATQAIKIRTGGRICFLYTTTRNRKADLRLPTGRTECGCSSDGAGFPRPACGRSAELRDRWRNALGAQCANREEDSTHPA